MKVSKQPVTTDDFQRYIRYIQTDEKLAMEELPAAKLKSPSSHSRSSTLLLFGISV